jgi:hypothetical protein
MSADGTVFGWQLLKERQQLRVTDPWLFLNVCCAASRGRPMQDV